MLVLDRYKLDMFTVDNLKMQLSDELTRISELIENS